MITKLYSALTDNYHYLQGIVCATIIVIHSHEVYSMYDTIYFNNENMHMEVPIHCRKGYVAILFIKYLNAFFYLCCLFNFLVLYFKSRPTVRERYKCVAQLCKLLFTWSDLEKNVYVFGCLL